MSKPPRTQRRQHARQNFEKSDSEEKKESDSTWNDKKLGGGYIGGATSNMSGDRPQGAGTDFAMEPQSPPASFLDHQEEAAPQPRNQATQGDVEAIRHSVGGTNNGLHHRHHFQSQTDNSKMQYTASSSPTRRRRGRLALIRGPPDHHQNRRRKWTVMQVVRTMLLTGATLYFFVMLRGTQILMQQSEEAGEDSEPSPGRLSDYFPAMQLPAGGYLRSGALSIESLAPFVHKATNDSPSDVRRSLKQRRTERRKRTQPSSTQPQATSITNYAIVAAHKRPGQQTTRRDEEEASATSLAEETQLCGDHARRARANNPEAFLKKDALMSSEAKVLITGIVSNPLAFHLALSLKERCGVEVLIGVDPMLPNSIRSRMQHMEQMQILSSNVPKMQPILVPLLGLDPRVKKSKKDILSENLRMLDLTGELNLLNFEPTHIVHLSAANYQNPVSTNVPQSPMAPKRLLSPYQTSAHDSYEPSLFQIRSSMMAMEQILTSIVSSTEEGGVTPHLTYASASMDSFVSSSGDDTVHAYSKLADEVLGDTYHSMFGAYSVSVRFPPNGIFGPWDTQTKLHQLLEATINGNFTSFMDDPRAQKLVYVQDAVDAVISSMQYRENAATTFEVNGSHSVSLSTVASMAESFLASTKSAKPQLETQEQAHSNPHGGRLLQKLEWRPETSLHDGLLKTLAWILDRASPFGPPPTRGAASQRSGPLPPLGTGDALLLANSAPTCAADEVSCHAGPTYLPCASECRTKAQCEPSIFDSVQQLTREMTEGCDAVLYTQSLGSSVEDLQLQSQYEDDVEPAICNLAFVDQSSPLVFAVIEKIPKEELERLGVGASSSFEGKLEKLNGRLLYRGWILIWVDPADFISVADSSLLKLSPGRLFADDVLYAVFVEENFTVSPTTDDVRFLISQMDRGATKQRGVWRMVKKGDHPKPKKVRFTISAQPRKRSSILVSQLKFKISERGRIPQDTKISIMDAVRFMRFEIGSDPTKQKESLAIKRQKDFYRRIPAFVNGKDLRDNFEPIYKYELKHWVRTRWVVHDLTLEESRELRCDWYQEHVQWGSEIDQLSFAAVMARRIIDRRMTLMEPDDRSKPKEPDITELKDVTDHNEWFAMATEHNKLHILQSAQSPGVQEVVGADTKDEGEEEGMEDGPDVPPSEPGYDPEKRPDVSLYVRIISDRIMSLSRKAWARYRQEMSAQAAQSRRLLAAIED